MNLLISIIYDWSRVLAGYLTWAGPLAVRNRRLAGCSCGRVGRSCTSCPG